MDKFWIKLWAELWKSVKNSVDKRVSKKQDDIYPHLSSLESTNSPQGSEESYPVRHKPFGSYPDIQRADDEDDTKNK